MDNLRKLPIAITQESKIIKIIRKGRDNISDKNVISPFNSVMPLHLANLM